MADKNQLSLANGVPPQLFSANSLLQSDYILQGQAQTRHSAGTDLSMNSNQLQKPMTSIVNGQVSPNVETPNWPQNSVNLSYSQQSGAGDSLLHQQPVMTLAQQSSPFQMNKSNVTYSGITNPKLSPNSNLSAGQQGSSVSMSKKLSSLTPTSMGQSPLNAPLIKQNLIRPSPVVGNRPKASSAGVVQSALSSDSDLPSPQSFQHTIQSNPIPQYSGLSPANPPNMTPANSLFPSQIRNQLYGPPTSMTLPPKSSSFNRPPIPNPPYTTYMPSSTLQGTILPTQLENSNQGSFSSNPPFSNVSQSFSQSNFQPQLTHHSLKGIPQGSQPLHSSTNQYSQKASTLNEPLSNEKQPRHGCAYSEHSTPIYQNQFVANRDLGHLASGMAPMPGSIQKQPNLLPLSDNIYGSTKPVGMNTMMKGMEKMSITQQGFNKLWGTETIDLLQCRNILPPQKVTPPPIRLLQEFMNNVNCSSEIFCCTLNKIPETNSLLQKSRLPLGILIHPFKDLSQLAVIQCSSIVRCRVCRTYINPFVYFVDNKRWKCNLCFRVNELPDEFQYDPVSKTYGDPSRRPEIRSSTIEFIAPSEYMLRPPQPAIYLFVLDVSRWGCDTGYLDTLCSVLLEELDNIPGDSRTQIGFILFDSTVHFFSIAESYNQAHEMIVTDIDDIFLPTPDSLLVNLNENRQLIKDLLQELPRKYAESFDTDSALGPALQAAYKLMSPTGGRITVFQSCLPNKGPGALGPREDPNQRSSRDVRHLGPQTDFYKRLSLDCSTQQISVDLFLVSSQYSDLATLSGVSQFSGGCIYHFPLFRRINPESNERLARALRRYLTRKIGFEAIMRVRCSRGLSIHTFHGNFFVRSTDLLSLPNVNPDAGFGMQIAIEDSLFELQSVCFQAAVLYTSAKGERRIRVHTLCLPVSSNLNDILTSADQQAIIGLLGKMAVDRSLKSTLSDAREAFINVAIDILSAYKLVETSGGQNSILAPVNLSLIPLYILALLKSTAFRTGQSTRLDDRVYAMSQMKTLPLRELIQLIHPDLYHVTHLDDDSGVEFEDKMVPQPARLSLSSEHLDSRGAFLLDTPEIIYILIGKNISADFLVNIFDVNDIRQINKDLIELPELENDESEKLRHFINFLQSDKPWPAVIQIATEPNVLAPFLINDKAENALSYYELLNHVKAQMK